MASRQDVQKRRVWAERLGRYRSSGLTVARFCASEARVGTHVLLLVEAENRLGLDCGGPRVRRAVRWVAVVNRRVGSYLAAGTAPPAAGAFSFQRGGRGLGSRGLPGRDSLPGKLRTAVRAAERSDAFQEVVVATR